MRTRLREKTASVAEVQKWYFEMKEENGEFPKAPDVALRFGISNSEAVRIINLLRDDWDNYDESKTLKLGLRIKRLEEALAITGLNEESSEFQRTKNSLNKIVKAGFLTQSQAKKFLSSSSVIERTHVLTELKDIRNSDVYKRVSSYIKRQIEESVNRSSKTTLRESHPIQIDNVEDFEELDARLIGLGIKYKKLDQDSSRDNEDVEEWLETLGERLSFVTTDGDGYAKESDVAVQVKRMWVVKEPENLSSKKYDSGNLWKLNDKITTYMNTYYKKNKEYPDKLDVRTKFLKFFSDVKDFEKIMSNFY